MASSAQRFGLGGLRPASSEALESFANLKGNAMFPYHVEFPDFDYTIPAVPGMADQSWHNDVCPVLRGNGVELWCDYADPALREFGADTKRFTINRLDSEGANTGECMLMTDNFAEALTLVINGALS